MLARPEVPSGEKPEAIPVGVAPNQAPPGRTADEITGATLLLCRVGSDGPTGAESAMLARPEVPSGEKPEVSCRHLARHPGARPGCAGRPCGGCTGRASVRGLKASDPVAMDFGCGRIHDGSRDGCAAPRSPASGRHGSGGCRRRAGAPSSGSTTPESLAGGCCSLWRDCE
jgi:hypothetical protein